RQVDRSYSHWWSRSPPSPRPNSTLSFGPAMNPSSDIDISEVTLLIYFLLLMRCARRARRAHRISLSVDEADSRNRRPFTGQTSARRVLAPWRLLVRGSWVGHWFRGSREGRRRRPLSGQRRH